MKTATRWACVLGLMAGMVLAGCKKEGSTGAAPTASPATAPATQPAGADTGGQTVCPVSGGKIDAKVFTEYQGKKVYFCCDGCIEPFKKDPAKYVKKLPQFGGKEEPAAGGMGM